MTLRRYLETPGGATGPVTRTVADTKVADAYRDGHAILEVGGFRTRVEKWVVSGSQVGGDPPVNGSWAAQFVGRAEVDVIGPIGEINPDGDSVAWIVHLPQGGAA
jgi:hypothetical protein